LPVRGFTPRTKLV